MADLNGKSVLITGASRGIGAAAAREFAKYGARVLLTARSEVAIAEIADEINASGGTALHLAIDVSNPTEVQTAVDLSVTQFGGLDIAIANAGIIDPIARIEDSDPEDWGRLIDVNVKGVYHVIRSALPAMKPKGGTLISVGSGAATTALEGWAHYSASKAAVHHLNACLHKEEQDNNIRALVLSPGTVATEMQVSIKESGINPVSEIAWEDHIPPVWAAKTLVWMSTPEADDWRGQVISLRDENIRRSVGLIS
jgi:NAD(P)-dependent dehydrogenase (short-subunit alcohol dehydrogenase family)